MLHITALKTFAIGWQRYFLCPSSSEGNGTAIMKERQVLSGDDIRRALTRISHEILERHRGVDGLVLVGVRTRGIPLAHRIAKRIEEFEETRVAVGSLDVRPYRDDAPQRPRAEVKAPDKFPVDINGSKVLLVDDVLFTGRTARAALDALTDLGRPQQVQLVVLVDRGHRELPIRPDYVGKNIPTALTERVQVRLTEIDGKDEVVLDLDPPA
jgi:pyrimidine operon attenuation protein/uracil phosphoribosyltransferase